MAERIEFGRAALPLFGFDPSVTFINQGSFGATPRVVVAARRAAEDVVHANPDLHYRYESYEQMRAAVARVVPHTGCDLDELFPVTNATTGCQVVMETAPRLGPGDAVLRFDTTYYGVQNGLREFARRRGFRVVTAALPLPATDDLVVQAVRDALDANPDVTLVVVDHIVSTTALVLPVARVSAECRKRGVRVLVDGAHAIGQIEVDLHAIGCDFYTGNLHKWLFTPKGVAVLYVRRDAQEGIEPPLVSNYHGDPSLWRHFWYQATRDLTPFLALPAAVDFYEAAGPARVREYGRDLARRGAEIVAAELWGADAPPPDELRIAPAGMHPSLHVVRLPFRDPDVCEHPNETPLARAVMEGLITRHSCVAVVWSLRGSLYFRASASIYNSEEDYRVAARCIAASHAEAVGE